MSAMFANRCPVMLALVKLHRTFVVKFWWLDGLVGWYRPAPRIRHERLDSRAWPSRPGASTSDIYRPYARLSLAQNIFLTNQRPWRALERSQHSQDLFTSYWYIFVKISNCGPKKSFSQKVTNFPQNALDAPHDHHFGCCKLPGNTDAITT